MTRQRQTLLCLVLLLLSTALPAVAQNCTVSATNVNFGNYTGSTVSLGGSPLSMTCPSGDTYSILLSAGQGSGASPTVRKMTNGNYTLSYGLYQNSAHTSNWGNSTGTGYEQSTGTGSAQTFYVYPQLTSGQQVPPGTYTDTISVSTTYNGLATFTVTATVVANCTLSAACLRQLRSHSADAHNHHHYGHLYQHNNVQRRPGWWDRQPIRRIHTLHDRPRGSGDPLPLLLGLWTINGVGQYRGD